MIKAKTISFILFVSLTSKQCFAQRAHAYSFTLRYSTFERILVSHGFPQRSVPVMYCIAKNESGFNPVAYNHNKNGSFDVGLFQINQLWKKWCQMSDRELLDIKNNVTCAKVVLAKQGYRAWVTFEKKCI